MDHCRMVGCHLHGVIQGGINALHKSADGKEKEDPCGRRVDLVFDSRLLFGDGVGDNERTDDGDSCRWVSDHYRPVDLQGTKKVVYKSTGRVIIVLS